MQRLEEEEEEEERRRKSGSVVQSGERSAGGGTGQSEGGEGRAKARAERGAAVLEMKMLVSDTNADCAGMRRVPSPDAQPGPCPGVTFWCCGCQAALRVGAVGALVRLLRKDEDDEGQVSALRCEIQR